MPDYGSDVWCDGDLRPDMPDISGRPLLIQDLRNRLETAPGTLGWDPQGEDYGFDLRTLVNAKIRDPRPISQRIADEIEKDDRVDSAEVSIELAQNSMTVKCTVDDGEGPFDFTISVTELTVEILNEGP